MLKIKLNGWLAMFYFFKIPASVPAFFICKAYFFIGDAGTLFSLITS